MRKVIDAITIPAIAPGCNADADNLLGSCSKGVPEDVEGDKVDENGGVEEVSDIKEVDIWDDRVLVSLLAIVVVVFNELLVLLGCKVVEYE